MSRRSPTRARIDAARKPGVEQDRVASALARRMDDSQLQRALRSIPARLAAARAADDPRSLAIAKRYREAFVAEVEAREVAATRKQRTSRKKKDRARVAAARAEALRAEFGESRMKVTRRVPPSRKVKPAPAAGVTQVVRGGSPGLGKRA